VSRKSIVGLGVAAALVIGYPALSWTLGRAVHANFDEWEQSLAKQPVQLVKVVDRKYTGGVFSSTEEVTLEFNSDLFKRMMKNQPGADTEEYEYDEESEDEASLEQAAWQPAADVAESSEPPRFTIRNEIKHGPLPGFTGVGLGRIESTLVFSNEVRAQLDKVIPGRDPMTMTTRLGLLGGANTHVSSPAFDYKDETDQVSWQGFEGDFSVGRNASSMECDATAPGLTARDGAGVEVALEKMTLTCDIDRVFDVLYAGKVNFEIASIHGQSKEGMAFRMERVVYATDTTSEGEFIDVAVKAGAGTAQFMQYQVSDIRYELSLRHLHGPTYAELSRKLQESMWSGISGDPTGSLALVGAFGEYGPKLLEHSPQLHIDHIGFSMPEGEMGIKGNVQLADFKRSDLGSAESRAALMTKIVAAADVWISEGLLNKDWSTPGQMADASASEEAKLSADEQAFAEPSAQDKAAAMRQQIEALEQQGYVTRKDGKVQAHIEFKGGALTANGKPLGAPGG
jgi:uncharacterized protein YdgA (DUF945 family)